MFVMPHSVILHCELLVVLSVVSPVALLLFVVLLRPVVPVVPSRHLMFQVELVEHQTCEVSYLHGRLVSSLLL